MHDKDNYSKRSKDCACTLDLKRWS